MFFPTVVVGSISERRVRPRSAAHPGQNPVDLFMNISVRKNKIPQHKNS